MKKNNEYSKNTKDKKEDESNYDDQVEGRNAVIELLESGKDINKIYISNGEKHGSINKIIALAKEKERLLARIAEIDCILKSVDKE